MKKNNQLNWVVLLSWIIFLPLLERLYRIARGLFMSISSCKDYYYFETSDWLINYEGGFVRRGLIGQILLWFERIHLYDVRVAIIILTIVASVLMLLLINCIFKKEGWSPLILPTGLCFGYTLFNTFGRRDLFSLLLTFIIFLIHHSLIAHPRKWHMWCAFYVVSILQILMHEAAFFFTFPILILITYQKLRHNHTGGWKSVSICLLQFLPILLSMTAVCLNKGDIHVAEAIWNSWKEVFDAYPSGQIPVEMGQGVQALAWDSNSTFIKHFQSLYFGQLNIVYWRPLIVLFFLLSTYYLLTRINSVNMGLYKVKAMNHIYISNVAIIQFIAMLPMLTILSCDWGRTIPYTVVSSLFFYHIYRDCNIRFPDPISNLSSRTQQYISNSRLLSSPYTYIILIIITPVPIVYAPFDFINTLQQFLYLDYQDRINRLIALVL